MVLKKFRILSFKKKIFSVSLKKVSISFGNRQILDNISCNVNYGEICGLLGPNGVGKSTMFNLILGLLKPDFGNIFFMDKNITNYPIYERTSKFKIGFVPQTGGYFFDMTLQENLMAVAELVTKNKNDRSHKIDKLIAKFELDSVRNIKAKLLSGGQRRKLAIAMALIGDPKLLILDEPFSALDILSVKMLQQIIVNLQTENPGMSIMISDHSARDLLAIVDNAKILSNGKIIAEGNPHELIENPLARKAYFGDTFKLS